MSHAGGEALELAEDLGSVLARLYAFMRRAVLPREMSPSQALALATLRDLGPQRVTDLAELEGVRQPTCTGLINAMENEGWVVRREDDSDRRAVLVELTEMGNDVLEAITDKRSSLLERYLSELSGPDRMALRDAIPALSKLIEIGAESDPALRRRHGIPKRDAPAPAVGSVAKA
jgi:DNA-binding MarR family transcriptional regulator